MHVEKQLATVLVAKRLAGLAPEVNLRECISCMPPPSVNKAAYSGFETWRRHHWKSKTGILSSKIFLKKNKKQQKTKKKQKNK